MNDTLTETTRTGYFARIRNALVGILIGLVLIVVAIGVLFWNEGREVRTARMLREGAANVIEATPATAAPADEGKLVHFSGTAVGGKLTDPLFGVTADGIRLERDVAMYQWKENATSRSRKDTVGGGKTTTTTYTYSKGWSSTLEDSSKFHDPTLHENPTAMRVPAQSWTAPVKVGAFTLPGELVQKIDNPAPLALSQQNAEHLPADLGQGAEVADGTCYVSGKAGRKMDHASPQIGDLRIDLRLVPSGPVSVMARQTGTTLAAYPTTGGQKLELLEVGVHPAREMIATEQRKNPILAWVLRGAGFIAIWIGLALVFYPIAVIADIVGFVGTITGIGITLASFFAAALIACVTMAIGWLTFRPLIGLAFMLVAAAGLAGIILLALRHFRKSRPLPQPAEAVPLRQ